MNEFITFVIALALFLLVILLGLRRIANKDNIPTFQLVIVSITLAPALTLVMTTIFAQEETNNAALLVAPILLAVALVSLQDFFNHKTSKQIEAIHSALNPENSKVYTEIAAQNEKLIAEINSLKKDIDELNSIITSKSVSETIIIEDRRSLISISSRFFEEK